MVHEIRGHSFELCPIPSMYWKSENTLIISDVHLGKASHFRINGLRIPSNVIEQNFIQLDLVLKRFSPRRVLFLGDLFHSSFNEEWNRFEKWIADYDHMEFVLVEGNHDVLDPKKYSSIGIKVVEELIEGPFLFTHIPLEEDRSEYNIAGHIHPGVRLRGKAKQSMRLPCFFFGKHQGILPAFGELTGQHALRPKKSDSIYIVAKDAVIKV